MIGAIVGDIVGSRFEFQNHRSKDFDLFDKACFATDDSIMSLAVCYAILKAKGHYRNLSPLTITSMQRIGRNYPDCGYGGSFLKWIFTDDPKPYNSFGNGAAMRVGGCGYAARYIVEAKKLAYDVTCISHNHIEGIKGAMAVATAIFMARSGRNKKEIRKEIEDNYYKIDFTLDEIRDSYSFSETCQDTVPQALAAFFRLMILRMP
jgi:type I restriction enzyme M protein